jgi:O-6-methylguanine DNA methyltransferase
LKFVNMKTNAVAIGGENTAAIGGQIKNTANNSGAGQFTANGAGCGPEERGARIAFTIADSRTVAAIGGQVKYKGNNSGAGELTVNRASYGPGGRGARIAFTIADSPLGRILIATTPVGLCWLGVGDSDARLETELRADLAAAEFTHIAQPIREDSRNAARIAEFARDADGLATLARTVVDYVSGGSRDLAFAIDLRATPFQIAVWRELCAIPRGATRSYGEIARRLGRPDASRAVGRANGANPLAIVIPCHRAIGGDGSLTGYRWGLAYKRRLLEDECALAQASFLGDRRFSNYSRRPAR